MKQNKILFFMSIFVFFSMVVNFSSDDPPPVSSLNRFWINNEYNQSATLKFGRSSRISRLPTGTYYSFTINNSSKNQLIDCPFQDLEYHEGIFLDSSETRYEFASREISPVKDTVKRVYWYPPCCPPSDSIFSNLNKKYKELGKIIVYEMSETENKKYSY